MSCINFISRKMDKIAVSNILKPYMFFFYQKFDYTLWMISLPKLRVVFSVYFIVVGDIRSFTKRMSSLQYTAVRICIFFRLTSMYQMQYWGYKVSNSQM